MNEAASLLLATLAGAGLGGFFFTGLWWTVRRALVSDHPGLWHFGSLMLRTGVTLAGFYAVGAGRWQSLLACLLGFVLARVLVLRLTRPAHDGLAPDWKEKRHAPQP